MESETIFYFKYGYLPTFKQSPSFADIFHFEKTKA